jgi:flagellar biosynthesis/type III secretory pathway chaperone
VKMETRITEGGERLLEALRHELHQYGEMLSLLDRQQQAVMGRAADDVLKSVTAVNEQTTAVEQARQVREARRADVAVLLAQPADATILQIVERLPQKYRPAIEALVRENNELLTRVRQRARQNHLLMTRSLELMQRVLNAFVPAAAPTTYTDAGKTIESGAQPVSLYDAVG